MSVVCTQAGKLFSSFLVGLWLKHHAANKNDSFVFVLEGRTLIKQGGRKHSDIRGAKNTNGPFLVPSYQQLPLLGLRPLKGFLGRAWRPSRSFNLSSCLAS